MPWACNQDDIDHLRTFELRDEDILDAVQIVALFNYFTRMADALGVKLNPGYAMLSVEPDATSP